MSQQQRSGSELLMSESDVLLLSVLQIHEDLERRVVTLFQALSKELSMLPRQVAISSFQRGCDGQICEAGQTGKGLHLAICGFDSDQVWREQTQRHRRLSVCCCAQWPYLQWTLPRPGLLWRASKLSQNGKSDSLPWWRHTWSSVQLEQSPISSWSSPTMSLQSEPNKPVRGQESNYSFNKCLS